MGVFTPERRRTEPPPEPPQQEPPRPPRRDVPWGLVALGLVIVAILFGVNWVRGVLPDFHNPFKEQTVDRSGPAVLKSLQDLHSYHAATGNFQQIVDLQKDTPLPDELLGSRTLYIAYGSVDATVDFTELGGDAVDVSGDRKSATITLPRPRLSSARIDPTRSYVYDQNEGALNKIGDLFASNDHNQQEMNVLAAHKIEAAAQQGSGLIARARENTRSMLSTLLSALGFTSVDVVYSDEAD
ncbi:MAG TPA: DUF4230 domain-containing protein [Gaiellaceae bacterium]|jgi:hypothetical protein|nr:DUF4230 domain-containing protein [Gaiellaceae bacterium]